MKKFTSIAAAAAISISAIATPVFADQYYGELNYTALSQSATTATCGEVVEFGQLFKNAAFDADLTNVVVTLTNVDANTVNITVTADNNNPDTDPINATATVILTGNEAALNFTGAKLINFVTGQKVADLSLGANNIGNMSTGTQYKVVFDETVSCTSPEETPKVIASTGAGLNLGLTAGAAAITFGVVNAMRARKAARK